MATLDYLLHKEISLIVVKTIFDLIILFSQTSYREIARTSAC